jgi:hypothetical protein
MYDIIEGGCLFATEVERAIWGLFLRCRSPIERDCSRCAECGKDNTKLDVHDIISIRNGDKHLLENLRTLCRKCHRTLEPSRLKRPHTNMNQAISMTVTVTLLLVLGAASSPAALAFDFGVDPNPITFPNPYTNSSIVKSTIVCQTGTYDQSGNDTTYCAGLTRNESASIYHDDKIAAIKDFKDFKIHPKTYSSSDTPPPCGPSSACVAWYVKFHEGYYDEWTHLCKCNVTAALGSRSVSHLFVPN